MLATFYHRYQCVLKRIIHLLRDKTRGALGTDLCVLFMLASLTVDTALNADSGGFCNLPYGTNFYFLYIFSASKGAVLQYLVQAPFPPRIRQTAIPCSSPGASNLHAHRLPWSMLSRLPAGHYSAALHPKYHTG
jgi:hypothetical protein